MSLKVDLEKLEFGVVTSWNGKKGNGLMSVKGRKRFVVFDLMQKQDLISKGEELEWTDPMPSTINCKKVLVFERKNKSEGNDIAVRWATFEDCCPFIKCKLAQILRKKKNF